MSMGSEYQYLAEVVVEVDELARGSVRRTRLHGLERRVREMGEGLGRAVAGLLRFLLAPVKGLVLLLVGLVRGLAKGLARIFTRN
jgi:hypothetical protein